MSYRDTVLESYKDGYILTIHMKHGSEWYEVPIVSEKPFTAGEVDNFFNEMRWKLKDMGMLK